VQSPALGQNDDGVDFKLIILNGEPVAYSLTSPTDGDILDRGFLARDVILTLRSSYGEAVVCTDRLGVELARAAREQCTAEEDRDAACFTLAIDTRRLPNGPNRLFFTLYDVYPGPGVKASPLAELRMVINVLNPRIEVDARKADGVRLRLEAAVTDPAEVKNYRFAIFAGRANAPSKILPAYEIQGPPTSIPAPVGPDPVKIFPRSSAVHSVEWPEATPYLYFTLNRATLVELSGSPLPKPVYLVAAVFDGKAWRWTTVCEVTMPPAGEGKIPASSR
jgi:hypothetical protein